MSVYIPAALLLMFFQLLSYYPKNFRSRKREMVCFSLSGIVLAYISAFRFNIGFDYPIYKTNFETLSNMSDIKLFTGLTSLGESLVRAETRAAEDEKGFVLLSRAISEFSTEFASLFAVTSVVFMALICVWLWKNSKYPAFGLTLLFFFGYFFNSMCFIRNMIAVAVFLYGIGYAREGRFLRYATVVLLASTFHFSAIFMLLLYPILRLPLTKITLGVYTGALAVFMVFSTQILNFVTKYVYTPYSTTSAEMANGLPVIFPILLIIVFVMAYMLRDRLVKLDGSSEIYLRLMYLTVFFEVLGAKHALLSRFALYTAIPAVCVLVPLMFEVILSEVKSAKGTAPAASSSGVNVPKAAAAAVDTAKEGTRSVAMILLGVLLAVCVFFFVFLLYYESTGSVLNGVLPFDWISSYNYGAI